MKKIVAIGCLLISVLMMGTGCGQSLYTQEAVTDEVVIERLNELAKEYLKTYFDMKVDEQIVMKESVTRYRLKDETNGKSEILILLKEQESEAVPQQGQLYSYQIMIDAESETLRGLYYGIYSTNEPKDFTDEQLDGVGRDFIKAHQMIPEEAEFSLLKIEQVEGAEYIKSLTYEYDEKYLLININCQDGKVMGFEYGA